MSAFSTRAEPRARADRVSWSLGIGALLTLPLLGCAQLAHQPAPEETVAAPRFETPAFDVMGYPVSRAEAHALLATEAGREALAAENGAVRVDEETLNLGEEAFYRETFGNEVFLTDIAGAFEGPLSMTGIAAAIARLGGAGTTNLRVAMDSDAVIGGRRFREGELVDTGLDVPRGALQPLGMPVVIEGTQLRTGISCALCHSTVDPDTHEVTHGAPNVDLDAGLLLALASNTASYLTHTHLRDVSRFATDPARSVVTADSRRIGLPDPQALEDAVDRVLMSWPPGSFDSAGDFVNNPTQTPDSFTWGDHPFNWSGGFMAGPFNGLSVQTNNVHSLNSDPFTQAAQVEPQFGMDEELYLAILLQNAAKPEFRWDPGSGELPSAFFARLDPSGLGPTVNATLPLPTFPEGSLAEPTALWATRPDEPVWQRINAMAAWQNTLYPPAPPLQVDTPTQQLGREVFERADCAGCHAGPSLSGGRIIPAPEIGTQPARADALQANERSWSQMALGYGFDQIVPFEGAPRPLAFPTGHLDPEQVRLAFGFGDSRGGYKTPSLIGLYWSPPYLHDGGVAVGPQGELGLPDTVYRFLRPDPQASLQALVDRDLRARVVAANRAHPRLQLLNVTGEGHPYWVDEQAGFSTAEQRALLLYLLSYAPDPRTPLPRLAPPPSLLRDALDAVRQRQQLGGRGANASLRRLRVSRLTGQRRVGRAPCSRPRYDLPKNETT